MVKDFVIPRAAAGALLLGACGIGIFAVDAAPYLAPPAYAGVWHPWVAMFALGGALIGAVFYRSPWGRACAFATALSLVAFECFDFIGRMPSSIPIPRSGSLVAAALAGIFTFLHLLPELVDPPGKR